MARRLEQDNDPLAELPASTNPALLANHVALVGYGRVGKRIAAALVAHNIPCLVADQNRELIDALRQGGVVAISGDANTPEVLIQAHIREAAMLVVAIPDMVEVRQLVRIAKNLNPGIAVVLRTHSEDEAQLLSQEGTGEVFVAEHELAKGMTTHILAKFEAKAAQPH